MSSSNRKNRSFRIENLEARQMFAADLGGAAADLAAADQIPAVNGATLGDIVCVADNEGPMKANGEASLGDIVCFRDNAEISVPDLRHLQPSADAADQVFESLEHRGQLSVSQSITRPMAAGASASFTALPDLDAFEGMNESQASHARISSYSVSGITELIRPDGTF